MPTAFPDLTRLKPEGGKRSSKREQIVSVFLRQEGHLSADDLVDIIRREDQRISRATVYRTLQWMVDAGIARKVDFGEGRFRFEQSYRQPRHFHLICKTCHRSFEFLSSDIEALVEEVAATRRFAPSQSVVQIYGTCESCRTGRPAAATDMGHTDLVFARDALRIAIDTERSGLEFYSRAARIAKDPRGRKVFHDLAMEEKEHLGKLEERYSALKERDPELASLAAARLEKLATTFDDVAAGAAFLDRFPESPHVETVAARINVLAENLYGEILLYQSVGDHVRAIDRIQKLLTHAPASPAAQKLLDRVVLPA